VSLNKHDITSVLAVYFFAGEAGSVGGLSRSPYTLGQTVQIFLDAQNSFFKNWHIKTPN
jgi:hypothetical protein